MSRKIFLLSFTLIVFSAAAYTYFLNLSPWSSKFLPPDIAYPDNSRYYGDTHNDLAEGTGEWISANGAKYQGQFKRGLFNGQGEKWYANGDYYQGAFRDGLANGPGQLNLVNGAHYQGEFQRGLFHGQGRFQYIGGDYYEGEFANDLFAGEGKYVYSSGSVYEGTFAQDHIIKGVYRDDSGNVYEGTFKDWSFHGQGQYIEADGSVYRGTFVNGALTGTGQAELANGEQYSGEFENWYYHGKGRLTRADGSSREGFFEYGSYIGKMPALQKQLAGIANAISNLAGDTAEATPAKPDHSLIEAALYLQSDLLKQSFQQLGQQRPNQADLFYLGVAGYGRQDVFKKEIDSINTQMQQPDLAGDRIINLINNPATVETTPLATLSSIQKALKAVAEKMDTDEDILFLYLTSHGSKEHEFSLAMDDIRLNDITPTDLKAALADSGIKWKVVSISACYSGGFIPELEDDHSLIMTAARADRASFGCSDTSDMTYFGRAYFNEALPQSESFIDAFHKAKTLIQEWEQRDFPELDRSEPQIYVGSKIEAYLQQQGF